MQNQLQEKNIQYEAIVAEAARIVVEHEKKRDAARAARKNAEDDKKTKDDKKKAFEELTCTKSRNSKLVVEANGIKTKHRKHAFMSYSGLRSICCRFGLPHA